MTVFEFAFGYLEILQLLELGDSPEHIRPAITHTSPDCKYSNVWAVLWEVGGGDSSVADDVNLRTVVDCLADFCLYFPFGSAPSCRDLHIYL